MLTVLNIGNTHSQFALWDGRHFGDFSRIETAKLGPEHLPAGIPVAAATVVPALKEKLGKLDIIFVDSRCRGGKVDFTKVDTSTLGADRVANAVALAEYYPLPGLVIDCGTAITVEIVDAAGAFRGGAIAPGRNLMRRVLFQGTAQLPEIPFSRELPESAGTDTVSSIRFGVDRGAIGIVRELAEQSAAPYGGIGAISVVATGGDAPFFVKALPFLSAAPEEFTFHGIRLAATGK